ncbi:MAG: hypothetical protein ACK53Y_11670, partial [bacterium]
KQSGQKTFNGEGRHIGANRNGSAFGQRCHILALRVCLVKYYVTWDVGEGKTKRLESKWHGT